MKKIYVYLAVLLLGVSYKLDAQWVSRTTGFTTNFSASFIDATNYNVAVSNVHSTAYGELYRTLSGGLSWENIGCPPEEGVWTLSMIDSLRIWIATTKARIYATSNGGKTWVKQFVDSSKTVFINYIKMFDSNNGIVMADAMTESLPAVFLRTTNGGTTWVSMNDSSFGGYSKNQWHMLSFLSPDTGYFFSMGNSTNSRLYKTYDGGKTWRKTNYPNQNAFCIGFYNEQIGIVGYVGFIRRTLDGGTTWEQFNYPSSNGTTDIEFMKYDPSKVWLLTMGELFFSSDTGRTWNLCTKLSNTCYDVNFPDANHGWIIGTNTVLYSENPQMIVSLKQNQAFVPSNFELAQNYPNPFNPTTAISYSLLANSHVLLKVYDLLGREVTTLVNEKKDAGVHTVMFDGTGLTSGVYLYLLTAGNYVETKKMILAK